MLGDSSPWSLPPLRTELWLYFMRSYDFVGNAIAALTDGDWSHTGLMIYQPDGVAIVYEAIFSDNAIDCRNAKARFDSFLAEDPRNRLLLVPLRPAPFLYGAGEVSRVKAYADSCVADVSYGRTQLLGMMLAQRFGIPLPDSKTKQVCSEFVSRCLGGGDSDTEAPVICDLRDDRHDSYDLVTPDSAKRRLMDILSGYGPFTQLTNQQRSPVFT